MKIGRLSNPGGMTVIELLVALLVCAIAMAAVYQIFVVQGKAYEVQDEIVEIQQNIRSVMELVVRDLRMAGFDYDNLTSPVRIEDFKPSPPYLVAGNSVTVWYENYKPGDPLDGIHQVTYALNGADLERGLTVNGGNTTTENLLENVAAFALTCGIDGRINDFSTQDGVADNWIDCGTVNNGVDKVIAIRITLTIRPEQEGPQDDRFRAVSPRTLTSIVALRNLSLKKI